MYPPSENQELAKLNPGTILQPFEIDLSFLGDSYKGLNTIRIIEPKSNMQGSYGYSYKGVIEQTEQTAKPIYVFVKTPKMYSKEPYPVTNERFGEVFYSNNMEYQTRNRLRSESVKNHVAQIIGYGMQVVAVGEGKVTPPMPYLVQEFIDGTPLDTYYRNISERDGITFTGIKVERDWFAIAKEIVRVVARVHNQQIVHGDIRPKNILMRDHHPVLVDFGQSFFLDGQQQTHPISSKSEFRAPESVDESKWDLPADIFALGGVLYFLATGQTPPRVSRTNQDVETFKREILRGVYKVNPELLRKNEGIVKIIDKCMRPNPSDRYAVCEKIINALENFNQEPTVVREFDGDTGIINIPTKLTNDFFKGILARNIVHLKNTAQAMQNGHYEIFGEREEIIDSLSEYLSVLGKGDQYLTVTLPEYWLPNNLGINGRFLTMNRMLAQRGVIIRRVFLLTEEDSKNPQIKEILQVHQGVVEWAKGENIDVTSKDIIKGSYNPSNSSMDIDRKYYTGYLLVSEEEQDQFKAQGRHVAIWQKANGQMMSIIFFSASRYQNSSQIVKVRFSSSDQQLLVRDGIEKDLAKSKPLDDYIRRYTELSPPFLVDQRQITTKHG